MNDKNDWIAQDIKISCKQKRSLYAFTKNSKDQKQLCVIYYKNLGKVIKEAEKQH